MKKQLFALIGLGLLLVTGSAYAQSIKVKAEIPFDFVVTGQILPSGEYTIETWKGSSLAPLSISGPGQKPSTFLTNSCLSMTPSERTKLVFTRYGDRYFLSEIWMQGSSAGRQLPKSRRELEMAQQNTVERVVILAELR